MIDANDYPVGTGVKVVTASVIYFLDVMMDAAGQHHFYEPAAYRLIPAMDITALEIVVVRAVAPEA